MARTSGRGTCSCVAVGPVMIPGPAIQRLNSINDLKKINFGQSVPKHSLLLLHWFANIIEIHGNTVIELPFDPNSGDYGSHHYGNYDGVLDPTPYGQKYYTVGNLNTDESEELPDYVVNPQAEYEGGNKDRVVFSIEDEGRQRIGRVFITQHYGILPYTKDYDPEHTYEITTRLLRRIREFSGQTSKQELSMLRNRFGSNANESQLKHIRSTWGVHAGLGLLLFIVIQEKHVSIKYNRPRPEVKENTQPAFVVNLPEKRQRPMEADSQQNTPLQVVAQRNTQPNDFNDQSEKRQNPMAADSQQNTPLQVVAQRNTQPNDFNNQSEQRQNPMAADSKQNTPLQVVAQRNTQPNDLNNQSEKRQNHTDGDISDTFAITIVVVVAMLLDLLSSIIRKFSIW